MVMHEIMANANTEWQFAAYGAAVCSTSFVLSAGFVACRSAVMLLTGCWGLLITMS